MALQVLCIVPTASGNKPPIPVHVQATLCCFLSCCLQVQGFVCDLSPGDTLLVPAYCFVHSQLTQPACVSLEVHLTAQPARLSSPGALMLQLSRMMELWFSAEAGPANVRKWFQVG